MNSTRLTLQFTASVLILCGGVSCRTVIKLGDNLGGLVGKATSGTAEAVQQVLTPGSRGRPPRSSPGSSSYKVRGRRYQVMSHSQAARYSETGEASYYSKGRQTANGERFNPNAMTAAHKTLPFGTKVRVTNVRNGRSVNLRINDRGPFVRGRIIDVTRRAADRLQFRAQGVTRVHVTTR